MIECLEVLNAKNIRSDGITLSPFSNPHETRRRRVSNIAICPPTYLPYSTYLGILHTSYSPVFSRILPIPPPPSIHPSTNPIHPSLPSPINPPQPKTMLPRPATKLHLTIDDITDYERRKAQRDALQQAQQTQKQQQQQTQEKNFVEEEKEESTRARAKAKSTRERIMGSRA